MLTTVAASTLAARCKMRGGGVIINEHTLTPAQTLLHVETLGRYFEFIHHDDLPKRLASPRRRPFCLLTFDDGKRSNAAQTAPVLLKRGVPAVFYVTTQFLSLGEPLWFDKYAALLRAVPKAPEGLGRQIVKQLPLHLLEERLNRACERLGIRVDKTDEDVAAMSWDDARALHRQGFVIGAHGVRHAILPRESHEAALIEIEQSMSQVTREVGAPCTTFAFPNGNYTARLSHYAQRCGATTVMTTEPTWADARSSLWRLPRIQLFGVSSSRHIRAKLALASWGCLLSNPDGAGTAYWRINRMAGRLERQ